MNFNISFELNIAPAMHFIGYYFFDFKTTEFKPALRARHLYEKFQLALKNRGPVESKDLS